MNRKDKTPGPPTFKDVLLARLYRAAMERRDVSRDLQAEVDARGRAHIERVCRLLDIHGSLKKEDG